MLLVPIQQQGSSRLKMEDSVADEGNILSKALLFSFREDENSL
jgi:hypothetical protein